GAVSADCPTLVQLPPLAGWTSTTVSSVSPSPCKSVLPWPASETSAASQVGVQVPPPGQSVSRSQPCPAFVPPAQLAESETAVAARARFWIVPPFGAKCTTSSSASPSPFRSTPAVTAVPAGQPGRLGVGPVASGRRKAAL